MAKNMVRHDNASIFPRHVFMRGQNIRNDDTTRVGNK